MPSPKNITTQLRPAQHLRHLCSHILEFTKICRQVSDYHRKLKRLSNSPQPPAQNMQISKPHGPMTMADDACELRHLST